MTCLYIVPNAHLRNFRRSLPRDEKALVMTMPGLVAQILKEGLVSYKEDRILEEVAVWQSVQVNLTQLDYFAPIAHYPGFMQELKWLFRQMDLGVKVWESVTEQGQRELDLLHGSYLDILSAQGVLTATGQMRRSVELAKEMRFLPEIDQIKLYGPTETSPLEQELIHALAQGRSLEVVWPKVADPVIEVQKARDPVHEVEMIGEALRSQIEGGIPLEKLGVAFPNPGQYLPILLPVFEKLKIPWRAPEVSLRNTPLGKALLTTLLAEVQGWQKHHLELLTAPGWGFPFGLTAEEHRLLRLAPPLKGFPAWRQYLGMQPGWIKVLDLLADLALELTPRPLQEHGAWLESLLDRLAPEDWVLPNENLENWAELVKAWHGLHTIAQGLQKYSWEITPEQFIYLLESLLDSYQIQGRRVFSERVQIMSVEHIGAYTYDRLYVGGLVEGQFPPRRGTHWLTKMKTTTVSRELYARLSHAAPFVHLSYPEVDREGKLNLPATILPKVQEERQERLVQSVHYPSLFLGRGFLEDDQLKEVLQLRVLQEGLSVSQLNSYANCPYQFFCSHILKLVPDEEVSLELDARDHGNIVHKVLQVFWEDHLAGPLPRVEDGQATVEGLLRREYGGLGGQPPSRLVRNMRDFIRHDLSMAQRGFRPRYLERWFQGLAIPTSQGPVAIRGRIDRIDVNPAGAYVLYDYKTGTAPQINAMLEGKDVQIAAYLLAAQHILPWGQMAGAAYYVVGTCSKRGIFHHHHHKALGLAKGKNVLDDDGLQHQNQKFADILQNLVERILQGEFPIEPATSRICSYCAFQGICRKEMGF